MSEETHAEQISRVEMMANAADYDTWDLSENDCTALTTVLYERAELLKSCKLMLHVMTEMGHEWLTCCIDAKVAIGEAEGKRMRVTLDLPKYEP